MDPTPDSLGAFVPDGLFDVAPTRDGSLSGLRFAVKDVIDVAGHPTSAGNPVRASERGPAPAHAAVVATLLDSGAAMVGKTVCDEFAYGISGTNAHHGTPLNPAAPEYLAGGSSCGSASAVAGGACDFALGTDTGGSVRIPASNCGIHGFRPTLARVPTAGVVPLAKSFDTVGWLAADVDTLALVGSVLLGADEGEPASTIKLRLATDVYDQVDPRVRRAVEARVAAIARLADPSPANIELAGPAGDLEALGDTYRTVSGWEAWQNHQMWIEEHPDALGPMAAERFRVASLIGRRESDDAYELAGRYGAWLAAALGSDTFVLMPTTPGPAPRRDSNPRTLTAQRLQTLRLSAAASVAGAPEVSLPLLRVNGLPLGLSIIGAPGSDVALLAFAEKLHALVEADGRTTR